MIRRSEETGTRALNWSLRSFDKIGRANTLRSVWAKLKSNSRVKGRKRPASSSSNPADGNRKKSRVSLNLSSTCDRLDEINLCTSTSIGCASAMSSPNMFGIPRERSNNILNASISASDACESDRNNGQEPGDSYDNTSDSMPGLALPSPETLSSDSGRSDTWHFTGGIIRGTRSVEVRDIECGTVTETGPCRCITNGFTSDGVVDILG